ncbi:hypothetical protein AAII07_32365 [Microvirga sp. 0TCS3.31]
MPDDSITAADEGIAHKRRVVGGTANASDTPDATHASYSADTPDTAHPSDAAYASNSADPTEGANPCR